MDIISILAKKRDSREMTVDEIEGKLLGNTCGLKPTSCADQLAKAVRKAYNESH